MNIKALIANIATKKIILHTVLFNLYSGAPLVLLTGLMVSLKGLYLPVFILALLPVIKNVGTLLAVYLHELSFRRLGIIMITLRVISMLISIIALFSLEAYLYLGICISILGHSLTPVFMMRYTSVVVEQYADEYHSIQSGVAILTGTYKLILGIIAAGMYLIDVKLVIAASAVISVVAFVQGVYAYKNWWSKY